MRQARGAPARWLMSGGTWKHPAPQGNHEHDQTPETVSINAISHHPDIDWGMATVRFLLDQNR